MRCSHILADNTNFDGFCKVPLLRHLAPRAKRRKKEQYCATESTLLSRNIASISPKKLLLYWNKWDCATILV